MTNETVCEEEKVTGNPVTDAEPEEVFEETDQEEEEFHLVSVEDENPFDDEKEEEIAEDFPMDSEEDDVEKAKKVIRDRWWCRQVCVLHSQLRDVDMMLLYLKQQISLAVI